MLPKADKDYMVWHRSQPRIAERIDRLIAAILSDSGLGHPKELRGDLAGLWSRRITSGDRLLYSIEGDVVIVHSCRGRY